VPERGKLERGVLEMVDAESLAPQNHLLRKIDAAGDWERLYAMVEPLYSEDFGRPSVDLVVLVKGEVTNAGCLSPKAVFIHAYQGRHQHEKAGEGDHSCGLPTLCTGTDFQSADREAQHGKEPSEDEKPSPAPHFREEAGPPEKGENPHWRLSQRLKPRRQILPARHPISARKSLTMKRGHEWRKYVYDDDDCVICPEYQPLRYAMMNRKGYLEYKSDPRICTVRPTRRLCAVPGTMSKRYSGPSGWIMRNRWTRPLYAGIPQPLKAQRNH
jgi:hypothetical protein